MVNGVTTGHLWDGTNIVAEICRDALGNEVYRYAFLYDTSGNLLVRKKTNADGSVCSNCVLWGISPHGGYSPAGMTVPESGNNPLCAGFMHNVHGDVVRVWVMTSISSSYVYDAYGDILEENIEFDWFSNPFRYAGYYYDTETGLYYLKNRYYNGYSTRFLTEDPYWNVSNMLYGKFTSTVERRVYYPAVVQSGNRYAYAGGNPVRFYDPSGHQREAGYYTINGVYDWYEDPDASEFGKESDTYKILVDLGNRWQVGTEEQKIEYHDEAELVRSLAREGTPIQYAQDKVETQLHQNARIATNVQEALKLFASTEECFVLSCEFLIIQAYGEWNYKYNSEWQVPYEYFRNLDMSVDNNRNWIPWMYFDGMLMGADKFGNLNMAYVGVKMGLPHFVYQNFATTDKDDAFWVQYGIDMAEGGR